MLNLEEYVGDLLSAIPRGFAPGCTKRIPKGCPLWSSCGVHTPLDEIHLENIFLIAHFQLS